LSSFLSSFVKFFACFVKFFLDMALAIIKMTNVTKDVVCESRDRPDDLRSLEGVSPSSVLPPLGSAAVAHPGGPSFQRGAVLVTREMCVAGAEVIQDRRDWDDPYCLARSVYIAMSRISVPCQTL
jgi:hypothetical protein